MPFCSRISNLTQNSRLVLSSQRASNFSLTFYSDLYRNHSRLLYLEFDVATKTVLSGNFSADGTKVQFRQRSEVLNDLALLKEGSMEEMLKISFPRKDQTQVVSTWIMQIFSIKALLGII